MTASPTTARPAAGGSSARRPPDRVTGVTVGLALASLISQMVIVVTGGAVRLTGSGLGCPTWPKCTPESLTTTAEMGIHGIIEFGNRTLTGVLGVIALLMIATLWRLRRSHRQAFTLSLLLLAGIVLQAVVGGVTVWMHLDPRIVGVHFVISGALIALATMLWVRLRAEHRHGAGAPVADGTTTPASRTASRVAYAALWLALVVGTLVTGTGPHSGDPAAARHGFDALMITRLHVVPVYITVAATLVLLWQVLRTPGSGAGQRVAAWSLLGAVLLQGLLGYWQHFTGLPVGVVAAHLAGATVAVVAGTLAWQRQTSRYRAPAVA
ncbi:COX15/CtaA family protein [Micrococcus porci]|uniref:COX15/CtaA family protein n=1 Tax=Micrococcus TaxID=1269 RepID=UPI001CCE26A1|nr:COX15/CtaA family protein [Micrococcus porci]MCG7423502.1 COX15/CtaA family protein [Micrococcus sp. ACRRV]UBH23901.1 COX15/CtaA family protein [Micrococcus porci]